MDAGHVERDQRQRNLAGGMALELEDCLAGTAVRGETEGPQPRRVIRAFSGRPAKRRKRRGGRGRESPERGPPGEVDARLERCAAMGAGCRFQLVQDGRAAAGRLSSLLGETPLRRNSCQILPESGQAGARAAAVTGLDAGAEGDDRAQPGATAVRAGCEHAAVVAGHPRDGGEAPVAGIAEHNHG